MTKPIQNKGPSAKKMAGGKPGDMPKTDRPAIDAKRAAGSMGGKATAAKKAAPKKAAPKKAPMQTKGKTARGG